MPLYEHTERMLLKRQQTTGHRIQRALVAAEEPAAAVPEVHVSRMLVQLAVEQRRVPPALA